MTRCLLVWLSLAGSAVAAPASLVDVLPPNARAAVVLQRGALGLLTRAVGDDAQMRGELHAFLMRTVGVDPTQLDGAIVWATQLEPKPKVAGFFRLPGGGQLRGTAIGNHLGVDIVGYGPVAVAVVPGGLVVGEEPEVREAIAAAQAHAGAQTPLGALVAKDTSSDVNVGVLVADSAEPTLQMVAQQWGVRTISLMVRADGVVSAEIAGDAKQLESLRQLLATMAATAQSTLQKEKDRATAGDDVIAGVSAITSYYKVLALWKEMQPRLVGDRLMTQYRIPKLEGTTGAVTIIGVLAAVAVPAFIKYVRRSKTVEATMNVRKLYDAAVAYREAHAGKNFRYPASTDWTPSRGCCGRPGDKCAPDATAWTAPAWKALNFSVDDPHYYQYRVVTTGKGPTAQITIEARGDLDCDGKFSLYRRVYPGAGDLYTQDDLE